ncbi:MAG: tripartite tricarboxylate transporter permease [Candidatus Micrarchaeota archaeon]|nr:tripartite tricarboxylate transporter permease [Candidatus Micrarchaeota archaeon]
MLAALAVAAGILLGIFSGLMPGIHSNTVAAVLAGMPLDPQIIAFVIVAVIGAHLVFQFFPSIFFSIPDDTVVASVLPGHRLALAGRGREAITICAMAVLLSSGAAVLLLPVSLAILPAAYSLIEPFIAPILVIASLFLLASERTGRKIAIATFVFLLAGALGMATLRGGIQDPLFPAFSGLFAGSGILLSFTSPRKLPEQKEEKIKFDFAPQVACGVCLGMVSDLLPGFAAPAQIAIFASVMMPLEDPRKFLALVASISASHAVFAFSALLSIGKAREGSLAIVNSLYTVTSQNLPLLLGTLLLSVGISAVALIAFSRHANRLALLNSNEIGLSVLAYLVCVVGIVSGAAGLLVFATATAVGLLPPLLGVRRTHVMGLIIIPSLLLAIA